MGNSLDKVVDAFIAMGPGAVLCIPLMFWIWQQNTRINSLTDSLRDLAVAATKAISDNTASSNRLSDVLSMRREDK